jgi:hypothetical protein
MQLVVAPHHRTGIDKSQYGSKKTAQRYAQMLEMILPKLHGPHVPSVQKMFSLPWQIIDLEKAIHGILPQDQDWCDLEVCKAIKDAGEEFSY